LLAISAGVAVMLCTVTCCVVRCFRPDTSRGAEWFPGSDGKERLVKGLWERTGTRGWLKPKDVTPAAVPAIPAVPTLSVPLPS
jgi:hypothetical protein